MELKLQRPLEASNPDRVGEVLCYDRGRKFMAFLPWTPQLQELFGDKPKVYVEGTVDRAAGQVMIEHPIPDQPW